jgi:hypothetical protein
MFISLEVRGGSVPASGIGISPSPSLKPELVEQTRAAAAGLPPLPTFDEVLALDRHAAFRELGYALWNLELVEALAARMRREPWEWLELAAGTGRLTAELARREIRIVATDDFSQSAENVRAAERVVEYGSWVVSLSAQEAVAQFCPQAIFCAWPPFGSGLVFDLLMAALPGSERLERLVCIGEVGGAMEAPFHPHEIPAGWSLERWPECEPYLVSFNDPPPGVGWRTYSQLLVYRRA